MILHASENARWNKTRDARMLGIRRTTLYKKLKEYQIENGKTRERDLSAFNIGRYELDTADPMDARGPRRNVKP